MNSGKKRILVNGLVFTSSFVVIFFVFEIVMHAMIKPVENAYGELFGRRLPPLDVVPWSRVRSTDDMLAKRKEWANQLMVKGRKITFDDLGSVFREDAEIGYVPEENYVSTNKWHETNSMGARARSEFSRQIPTEAKRVLLFGDSFTEGMRLPQNETWAHYLNKQSANLEVINFGVGGYGMGQSYLRYRQVKDKLQYDYVFLMIVPTSDLFRDINTIRSMAKDDWDSHKTNARFILQKDQLVSVPGPYKKMDEMVRENQHQVSDKLLNHLEKYESYYYPPVYESNSFFDQSVFYKLLLVVLNENHKLSKKRILMKPDSEPMKLNRKIFIEMSREVSEKGAELVVIVLPREPDVKKYRSRPGFHHQWNEMVAYFQSDQYLLWNLMDEFQSENIEKFDKAYDNTHYGPQTSRYIADFIWARYSASR